ncbi:hypothetical protein HZS_7285 [Henneguya salminicola]|nr:hypothetical protein HZS_7285 [Henneguya salminicola]
MLAVEMHIFSPSSIVFRTLRLKSRLNFSIDLERLIRILIKYTDPSEKRRGLRQMIYLGHKNRKA